MTSRDSWPPRYVLVTATDEGFRWEYDRDGCLYVVDFAGPIDLFLLSYFQKLADNLGTVDHPRNSGRVRFHPDGFSRDRWLRVCSDFRRRWSSCKVLASSGGNHWAPYDVWDEWTNEPDVEGWCTLRWRVEGAPKAAERDLIKLDSLLGYCQKYSSDWGDSEGRYCGSQYLSRHQMFDPHSRHNRAWAEPERKLPVRDGDRATIGGSLETAALTESDVRSVLDSIIAAYVNTGRWDEAIREMDLWEDQHPEISEHRDWGELYADIVRRSRDSS